LPSKKRRKFEVSSNDKKEENSGIGGFEEKLKGVRDSLDLKQDSHKELYKKTLLLCLGILGDPVGNESVKLENNAKLEQIKLESRVILNNGQSEFTGKSVSKTENFEVCQNDKEEENSGIRGFEKRLKEVRDSLDLKQDSHKERYKKALLLCMDLLRDSDVNDEKEENNDKREQIKPESQVILNNGQSEFTGESVNKTENVEKKVSKKRKRDGISFEKLVEMGHYKKVFDNDGVFIKFVCSYCEISFKKSHCYHGLPREHLEGKWVNGRFRGKGHRVDINKNFNEQDSSKLRKLKKRA
jgi:hypothetical protein